MSYLFLMDFLDFQTNLEKNKDLNNIILTFAGGQAAGPFLQMPENR